MCYSIFLLPVYLNCIIVKSLGSFLLFCCCCFSFAIQCWYFFRKGMIQSSVSSAFIILLVLFFILSLYLWLMGLFWVWNQVSLLMAKGEEAAWQVPQGVECWWESSDGRVSHLNRPAWPSLICSFKNTDHLQDIRE